MPLVYLIDEDSRDTALRNAIQSYTRRNPEFAIDCVSVGDEDAPSFGTRDPELIRWANENNRVIVTRDRNTMIQHYRQHAEESENPPPPLFVIRSNAAHSDVSEYLALASTVGEFEFHRGACYWIPQ